jgi:zinc transport system substrate-binding protein
MKNRILLLLVFVCTNMNVYALPKITTSITPIASIVAMLTEGSAEITAINISPGCPHHYNMKPSDRDKIANTEILIYIDDKFDGYAAHLSSKSKGKVVKISEFESINFLDENGQKNWHFWLDLDNVLAFQSEIAEVIKKEIPSLAKIVGDNMNKAKAKIESLRALKSLELSSVGEMVVLSDSIQHFIKGLDSTIIKLYQKQNSSLKDFGNLEYILNTDKPQCLVLDSLQNPAPFEKFNKKIIQLETENWEMPTDMSDSADLFCTKYLKMINQLKACH